MPKKKLDEPLFEPIAIPKRNFEVIEATIRRQIYDGSLVPGQKLPNEPELARQFNVGRSAVREALKILELAGLLLVRRGYNGGTFVAPPDFEDARETIMLTYHPTETTVVQLMEAALTIEVRTAELAAQRATALEINDLQEIIERAGQSVNVPARYLAAITDFYVAVAELSHNNIFILVFSAIRNPLMQELNRLISDQKLRNTFIADQREICSAIAEHNSLEASKAMHKHLCHINDRLRIDRVKDSKY